MERYPEWIADEMMFFETPDCSWLEGSMLGHSIKCMSSVGLQLRGYIQHLDASMFELGKW
jgi:hypothetical protein